MEFLRKIFNNAPVLAGIAIAFVIATIFINIDAYSKLNVIRESNMITDTPPESTAPTDSAVSSGMNDKELQDQELNSISYELSALSNQKSTITGIIDRYIELRYNYTDGPDKEYILDELSGITCKSFLGTVDNSLNYLSGDSTASVVKRYATVYSTNSLTTGSESTIDTFVYIVNINGENKVMGYTMFQESGKWAVYSEKEFGTIGADVIRTEDLLSPDVIKPVETENTEGSSYPAQTETEKGGSLS